ncbi:MAG: hypothetical protein ABI759_10645 [Candidatus Solibacter sp.]
MWHVLQSKIAKIGDVFAVILQRLGLLTKRASSDEPILKETSPSDSRVEREGIRVPYEGGTGQRRREKDPELARARRIELAEFQDRMLMTYGIDAIRDRFGRDVIPDAAIYGQAGESSSEYYRWRSGELRDGSGTQLNISQVLRSRTWPNRPPPSKK